MTFHVTDLKSCDACASDNGYHPHHTQTTMPGPEDSGHTLNGSLFSEVSDLRTNHHPKLPMIVPATGKRHVIQLL